MIVQSPNNPFSHLTIKEREWPSFPTKQLLSRGLIKGRVLDFGCGTGVDVQYLREKGCDVIGYDPYFNQIPRQKRSDCPFCDPTPKRELLSESATVYAMLDQYPVSPGHALIIPKNHMSSYFDLPDRVRTACWLMVARVQTILSQRFRPEGFNIGINVGVAAGQTVPHVHIHLIPRYPGDAPNPVGGVRNVIPGQGDYLSKG
jgi:ATP adenylyltransferase